MQHHIVTAIPVEMVPAQLSLLIAVMVSVIVGMEVTRPDVFVSFII